MRSEKIGKSEGEEGEKKIDLNQSRLVLKKGMCRKRLNFTLCGG